MTDTDGNLAAIAPGDAFAGLRVAAFESRRADEMARLISSFGGMPFVSPSMREVPISNNPAALEFSHRLLTGEMDVLICLTGVGFGYLWDFLIRHVAADRLRNSLADIVTIARGPKPVAAMKSIGLEPTHRVPEPNTWREVLQLIDAKLPVANLQVGIQEYGESNASLIAGLEARGARVVRVPVYAWAMPLDRGPLEENVQAICNGQRDVMLFTTAQQVRHVDQVAIELGLQEALLKVLPEIVVGSIGPTTSEALEQLDFPVDIVPTRSKLGPFVREVAQQARDVKKRKRRIASLLQTPVEDALDRRAPWYDSPFMKACRREPTEVTPVWFMRQAGRYLPEYRAIRANMGFLELCHRPELCAEIMVNTVHRLGVDAAIIFSDLLPILEPMGLELEYSAGEGPVIHNPLREPRDVDRCQELSDLDRLDFVFQTVTQTRRELPAHIPLIGFAGAPFTLASYAIEGGASRDFIHTKTLMYRDESAWRELMQRISRSIVRYLNAQIRAGAQCVQLFDSWVGCLGPEDYRRYVQPYVCDVICQVVTGVPVILFSTGNPALLPHLAEARPAVVGVDWRIRLDTAWQQIGAQYAVQGNLDPAVLLASPSEVSRQTRAILRHAGGRFGHIFNLGHGILPPTPVENLIRVVEEVHGFRPES